MQIRTLEAKTYSDIDAGQTLLEVPWEIFETVPATDTAPETENILFSGRQSFPLTVTADEVRAFLAQALETHTNDSDRHEAVKDDQAALDNASAVVEEISNVSL